MTDRYYVTTSIPYVNAAPHLGFALEAVQADVFARYHRLLGEDTRLLTGTDDNSLKNVLAAERAGVPVRDLVDRNARVFRSLSPALDLTNDDFIRTSADARHLAGVRHLWQALDRRGDLYKRPYEGLYCVGCEQFYTPDELVEGRCPVHVTVPEVVREENYFFRLSRYQGDLQRLLASERLRIVPESRRNEVQAFVARGLQDFSVSRSRTRARGWGIEVPGDPEQVVYVWLDALANYITALGYGGPDGGAGLYRRYWGEGARRVHVIGKDIIRFHAVYWPAILLSAGEPLPDTIFVHGFLTVAGRKLSKSTGHVVDPFALATRYGVDAVRYWLLRDVPPTADADYTAERLERRYTADLANDLGNLLQRTVGLLHRYRAGHVPVVAPGQAEATGGPAGEVASVAREVQRRLPAALGAYDPQEALEAVWHLVGRANRYVEETAPWALARRERDGDLGAGAGSGAGAPSRAGAPAGAELDLVLATLAEALRLIGEALRPLLPRTADAVLGQLGVPPEADWRVALRWGRLPAGTTVGVARPLFPRLAGRTGEPVASPPGRQAGGQARAEPAAGGLAILRSGL
jgi:methionyl-tRNA synthetase